MNKDENDKKMPPKVEKNKQDNNIGINKDKDLSLKLFLSNNEAFANVANAILFEGKEVIKSEDLKDTFTDNQYENISEGEKQPIFRENHHDVCKVWSVLNQQINIATISIENQSDPKKTMLPRVMHYDASNIEKQIRSNNGTVTQPITIVIYTGKGKWNSITSIYELCDTKNKLKKIDEEYRDTVEKVLFNDYHYVLFDVNKMDETIVERFTGDPRLVFEYFMWYANGSDGDPRLIKAMQINQAIKNPEETLAVLDAFSDKNKTFLTAYKSCSNKIKEKITMCDVVSEIINIATNEKEQEFIKEREEFIKEREELKKQIREKDEVIAKFEARFGKKENKN